MSRICIFCLREESRKEPFVKTGEPGQGCTYGLRCEHVEGGVIPDFKITPRPPSFPFRSPAG